MLADKVHIFIHLLDACKVCLRVVGKLYFLAATDSLGLPVEVTHLDRATDFTCDGMESCLPSLHRLACTLRCQSQVDDLFAFHLPDHTQHYVAAFLSVDRDASHLAEQPAKRSPEQFAFDHAVRLASD